MTVIPGSTQIYDRQFSWVLMCGIAQIDKEIREYPRPAMIRWLRVKAPRNRKQLRRDLDILLSVRSRMLEPMRAEDIGVRRA